MEKKSEQPERDSMAETKKKRERGPGPGKRTGQEGVGGIDTCDWD